VRTGAALAVPPALSCLHHFPHQSTTTKAIVSSRTRSSHAPAKIRTASHGIKRRRKTTSCAFPRGTEGMAGGVTRGIAWYVRVMHTTTGRKCCVKMNERQHRSLFCLSVSKIFGTVNFPTIVPPSVSIHSSLPLVVMQSYFNIAQGSE